MGKHERKIFECSPGVLSRHKGKLRAEAELCNIPADAEVPVHKLGQSWEGAQGEKQRWHSGLEAQTGPSSARLPTAGVSRRGTTSAVRLDYIRRLRGENSDDIPVSISGERGGQKQLPSPGNWAGSRSYWCQRGLPRPSQAPSSPAQWPRAAAG